MQVPLGALLYGIPTGITVWKKFTAEKKYTRLTHL